MDKTLLETTRKFIYKNGRLLNEKLEDNSYITTNGYRALTIEGKKYLLHRLVWFFWHGEEPTVIDHINGNKQDNRIENLQNCTQKENIAKSKMFKTNTSGFRGVSQRPNGKYEAYVTMNYKRHYLGIFTSAELAYNARITYLKEKEHATNSPGH